MKSSEFIPLYNIASRVILFVLLLFPGITLSSGFQLIPTTSGIARSLGGNGIIGDDLGDMFYNPAGLSLQTNNGIQADIYHIKVENNFRNQGSSQSVLTPLGSLTLRLEGGANNTSSDTNLVPIIFIASKLRHNLTFGLGITTPMGLSTTYEDQWIGRYQATQTELNVIDINPAISKQVNDHLIIAGGISFQYASADLSQAVPTTTPGLDALVKVSGDDMSLGFNAGAIISPNKSTRLGLAYRSKISHTLSGDSTLSIMGMPIGAINAEAPLTLPESIYLSYYQSLQGALKKWSIAAGIRWTKWSRFKQIRVNLADGSSDITPQNWKDTYSFGISTDYVFNNLTKFIFSLGYDKSAVRDPVFRSPQIPDTNKFLVGLGVDRNFSWGDSNYTVGFGWQRVILDSRAINRNRPLNAGFSTTLSGEFTRNDIDVFSIKLIRKGKMR